MFPVNRKPVPVAVEYDADGNRVRKVFQDPYAARRFYAAKLKVQANPRVVRVGDRLPSLPYQA